MAPGTGYEAGARFELGTLKLTSSYWWLNLDSELIFVGDSNSVEPRGGSRREGYELTAFWRPVEWLGIDAVYTGSRARYVDNPDGPRIEGSLEHAGQFGISAVKDKWEASLRVRHLGEYALVPDNSQRAEAQTSIGIRGAYTTGKATWYAELLNLLDEDGKDIVYWYEAYVDGLDPPGLTSEDIDCERHELPDEPCRGAADAARRREVRVLARAGLGELRGDVEVAVAARQRQRARAFLVEEVQVGAGFDEQPRRRRRGPRRRRSSAPCGRTSARAR